MQATLSSSASNSFLEPPLSTPHFLVVDASDHVRRACGNIAAEMGFLVLEAGTAAQVWKAIADRPPDLLLLDLEVGSPGMALLKDVRRLHPALPVVVMTEYATVGSAIEAMRLGVGDFLAKPFTVDELAAAITRAQRGRDPDPRASVIPYQTVTLYQSPTPQPALEELVGRSSEMEKLSRILSKVAFTHHPVLILGEGGTGKELIARSIHFNGSHPDRPFHLVDCAATSPDTLEADLFGRSCSGPAADAPTPGMLSSPEGGTVFLDEVAALLPELQSRLIRALQDREVRVAGATDIFPLTARILAASSRNLTGFVDAGRFRKDLFYRLNVVNLKVPALRDRAGDIPALAQHFLARLERETGATLALSGETLHLLQAYDWPGNVRELEAAMERACALTSGPILHLGDLPTQLQEFRRQREAELAPPLPIAAAPDPADLGVAAGGLILSMADIERQVILKTLRQLKGDKLLTARLLGIGKTTLYRKLKEYGIGDEG